MAWCLFILSIIVSAPCILIYFIRLMQTNSISTGSQNFLTRLTAGSVYLSQRYNSIDNFILENAEIMIDVVVYFNMLGIVYLLIHSIILRR